MKRSLFSALLAALASSLCCIAPLLAAFAGVGGLAGAFSWLEPWRPWLIGLSAVLLGWAWWMHLKPKPAADCCTPVKPKWFQRKGFLATITVLAVLLNAFPLFSSALISGDAAGPATTNNIAVRIAIPVKGMTCTGCEHHVTTALSDVPGVQRATASHADEEAVVWVDPQQIDSSSLRAAIVSTGYEPGTIIIAMP